MDFFIYFKPNLINYYIETLIFVQLLFIIPFIFVVNAVGNNAVSWKYVWYI